MTDKDGKAIGQQVHPILLMILLSTAQSILQYSSINSSIAGLEADISNWDVFGLTRMERQLDLGTRYKVDDSVKYGGKHMYVIQLHIQR